MLLTTITTLGGFALNFAKPIFEHFKTKQENKHELDMLDKQLEATKLAGAQKLQMINVEADIRESEALHKEHSETVKRAPRFIVGLAASVRPVLTYIMFLEFMVLTGFAAFDVITPETFDAVWTNESKAMLGAMIGFWFGNRVMGNRSTT